jgi:hypothetical protein
MTPPNVVDKCCLLGENFYFRLQDTMMYRAGKNCTHYRDGSVGKELRVIQWEFVTTRAVVLSVGKGNFWPKAVCQRRVNENTKIR